MVKNVKAHAEEDKKRKAQVEGKNYAEALVHSTEKTLAEHGSKVGDADRRAIENAIADLKQALKGNDADATTAKTIALAQASMTPYVADYYDTTRPGVEIDLSKLRAAMSAENADHNSAQGKDRNRSPGPASPLTECGLDRVAGMHVLKELLRREVVAPIKDPEPFRKYGLSIPNGILLYGPPGCGKTYVARQLAEELGHYFVEIIPSELASTLVHGSVIKIRNVFDAAAERAPAVVFIDEFEALVPSLVDLMLPAAEKSPWCSKGSVTTRPGSIRRVWTILW